jgi:hypothetical protein
MKRALMFVLMCAVSASAGELKLHQAAESPVVHVATALDHLTVLEFGEPVTMAAAGSSTFQIERHDNKVFIRPLKAGASTDLFVWTASRRFAYELESPGEIKDMNFAIDNRIAAPKPALDTDDRLNEIADITLMHVFLGAERVDSTNIKDDKGQITVRIEQVFQSKNGLYIHYSIRNRSARPYRVTAPTITAALAPQAKISIASLQNVQLDAQLLRRLGELREHPMTPARAETQKEDLRPGEDTQGVLAIRGQVASPAILQLTFAADRSRPIQATMVF